MEGSLNLNLIGNAIHEILLDGSYKSFHKLDCDSQRLVELFCITAKCRKPQPLPGDLVMDMRPLTYGKLYVIKSVKADWYVMKNGIMLTGKQFQLRNQ